MYLLCFCAVSLTVLTAWSRTEAGIPTVDKTHCRPLTQKLQEQVNMCLKLLISLCMTANRIYEGH